jgi:hypothetical protein
VVDNKTNGEIFIRNIGFKADTVLIDPEYWLITKNNTSQKIPDAVSGQNNVQVYPNPFQNQFYVYLRNFSATTAFVNLYNASGQLLYSRTMAIPGGSEFAEIPSQRLPRGIYILGVRTADGLKISKKIVK